MGKLYTQYHARQAGFTLVELSIVLVIIGLIAGSVFVGQQLIFAAEVKGAITQLEQYNKEIITFRTKYDYLPGDIPNATNYWPSGGANCTNGNNASNSYSSTCNGNGNGHIDGIGSTSYPNSYEVLTVFQQLVLANLDNGKYLDKMWQSPYPTLVGTQYTGSQNAPNNNGNMCLFYDDGLAESYSYGYYPTWNFTGKHVWELAYGGCAGGSLMSPARAGAIDSKIDDGKPLTGNVTTPNFETGSCMNSTSTAYLTTNALVINGNPWVSPQPPGCKLFVGTSF